MRPTLILGAVLAVVSFAASLTEPTVFNPDSAGVTSVTLTVDAARVTVAGFVTFSTRAYHVNGVASFPGPILKLKPGGTLNITLINNLQDDTANDANRAENTFRHVNQTNIHTHGIHVDPAIDSIFRVANAAGGQVIYSIPIPANHAPGMHWFHAHRHGSSTLQVMGGLVGMLYVNPPTTTVIPTALSALTTHFLLIHRLKFSAETANGATTQSCSGQQTAFNPFKAYSFSELESESGSTLASNPTYATTNIRDAFLVNGQYQPTISMDRGETRILRMVFGAGMSDIRLSFSGTPTCTMNVLAKDGVYLTAPREQTSLYFVPGSRVEVAVTCATTGTATLRQTKGTVTQDLLFFTVSGTAAATAATLTVTSTLLSTIARPTYLNDMQGSTVTIDTRNSVSFAQGGTEACKFWLGMGSNCAAAGPPGSTSATCSFQSMTGQKGTTSTANYRFTMRVGQTSEWTITGGGNQPHPLHIHVNHYQVISFTANPTSTQTFSDYLQVGDWHDVVPVLDGTLTIRFIADAIAGETILHCHELNHEDKGLMDSFLIQPSNTPAPPTTTTTTAPGSTSDARAVVSAACAVFLALVALIAA